MGLLSSPQNSLAAMAVGDQCVFKIRRSSNNQFYWTFHNVRGNTEPMAQSETYTSKQSCEHSIDQLKRFAANAAIDDLS